MDSNVFCDIYFYELVWYALLLNQATFLLSYCHKFCLHLLQCRQSCKFRFGRGTDAMSTLVYIQPRAIPAILDLWHQQQLFPGWSSGRTRNRTDTILNNMDHPLYCAFEQRRAASEFLTEVWIELQWPLSAFLSVCGRDNCMGLLKKNGISSGCNTLTLV